MVRPDMTIAHEFSPAYPSLGNNETYGLTLLPGEDRYVTSLLASATPGQSNAGAITAEEPIYSWPSGIFTSPFTVALSVSDPNSEIRYTLDGSEPTLNSTLYTDSLSITQTARLRARAFHPVRLPGPTVSRYYLFLAGDTQTFTSDLPVIVIENFDAGSIPGGTVELQSVAVAVLEPDAVSGRTSMTDGAELLARAGHQEKGPFHTLEP